MLRKVIQNISEAKIISAATKRKPGVTYNDVLDWLDVNGGYESIDQYAKGELGIKSSWSSELGSLYSLTPTQFKKFEKLLKI